MLLCFALACCHRNTRFPRQTDTDEITAACLLTTFGTADSAKYYRKLLYEFPGSRLDPHNRIAAYNDSMATILKTSNPYLHINDTLGAVSPDDTTSLGAFMRLQPVRWDTVSRNKGEKINLKVVELLLGISTRGGHLPSWANNDLIGHCRFSGIVFSHEKKHSAVCMVYYSSHHMGYAENFLLEKTGYRWRVIKRERTWVS